MSKSKYLSSEIGKYIFTGVLPEFHKADAYFISLHDEDPLLAENEYQSDGEVRYEGYTRIKAVRDSETWSVIDTITSNGQTLKFPACISGNCKVKYISIGLDETGNGHILYSAKILNSIDVFVNKIPIIAAQNLTFLER